MAPKVDPVNVRWSGSSDEMVPQDWNVVHPVTKQKITVNLSAPSTMTKLEFFELFSKTGTTDEFVTIGDDEMSVLRAMSSLRNCRLSNIARQDYINNRARRVVSVPNSGEYAGASPASIPRSLSASEIMDLDPDHDEGTGPSLVAHGRHINENMVMSNFWGEKDSYVYKMCLEGGFRVTLRSQEAFSDEELMQAREQIRLVLTDPLLEEELVMQKGMKDTTLELPSTQSALKDGYKLLEWLKIDKELDRADDHKVVVKEVVEGIPPPYPLQLLQEFPSPTSTIRYDYEFSPRIREPWMAECHAGVSPSFDRAHFSRVVGPVVPTIRYPDLQGMSLGDNQVTIHGKKFDISFDCVSGVVDKVRPLKDKYQPEEGRTKVRVDGVLMTTNYAQAKKAGLKSKYVMGRNRRLAIEFGHTHMVPILYTILLCGSVLAPARGQFICGDDKHGTLWTLPDQEDCKPAEDRGLEMELRVYNKLYSYNMTVYRCYTTTRSDTTIYGFFGPKSHLGYTVSQSAVSLADCSNMIRTKRIGGSTLLRAGDRSWSTSVQPDVQYTWCCAETVTKTTNYHLEEVLARVHLINGYAVIVSSDSDVSHCSYNSGNCSSKTSTYVWEKRDVSCDIQKIGAGKFTIMPDGHAISYDLQISLMIGEAVEYCGSTYNMTEQGILVQEVSRSRRDVDAAEKSYVLKAASGYARKMSMAVYYSLCNFERMWINYMSDMARSNPTRFARTYLNRHDIAAKFVGEALLVWECKQVEVVARYKGHRINGQCYDLMPIEYEIDRVKMTGFLDTTTNEISPISSTHDCNSVSGYIVYEGEWRKYVNDTHYDIVMAVQKIPSNIGSMDVREVSFKNNKLHSVYGPAGSQYREFLVNDLTALSAKHILGHDVKCDEVISTRISGMVHDTVSGIREALFWPIKMIVLSIVLLIVGYLLIVKCACGDCWRRTKCRYGKVFFSQRGEVIEIQD
ncbi:hypothetical protein KM538_s3gp1 [Shuangao chryso-like virus 1]|uniref:Glycoprotein n=1 Tax=Shuangao chryso-like virus 1 TaxID=1923465 RepID=A0A1Z2RTC8_9VIRU|nr:hypothetical protein KM538_s3gp1 [Shuangao chryso-like virus 1]ASA47447.1 hypothetical protein [Shuangao chryso-like virus 1]